MSKQLRTIHCVLLFIAIAFPPFGYSNGRPTASTDVEFFGPQRQKILLATTFGALISEDQGETFYWLCEDAIGYGGVFDPVFKTALNGNLYATTWQGLRYSTDGGCTFENTEFHSANDPAIILQGVNVRDLDVQDNGTIWATTAEGGQSNDVYFSNDGIRFDSANLLAPNTWYRSIRVAPSNNQRIYVAKYVLATAVEGTKAFLLRSDDGGQSWQEIVLNDIEFGGQAWFDVLGVSKDNPDVLYARSEFSVLPDGDIIYRSDDAGESFVEIARFPNGRVNAFEIRHDGSVMMGTATRCIEDDPEANGEKGCVLVSPDGTPGSFVSASAQPQLACVKENPFDEKLYACGDNYADDEFALGVSADAGTSWSAFARFENIVGPIDCPGNALQQNCAIDQWPLVCEKIGLCVDEPPPSILVPKDSESCSSCSSSNLGGGALLFVGMLFFGWRRKSR